MTFSTVLFDLDGTLTDSAPGITNAVSHALTALGHEPLPIDELRSFIGPPLQESFAALGLDPDVALTAYREYFTDRGIYENQVYDGIIPVLGALRARNVELGVATSKPTVYARRILDHFALTPYFSCVSGAELDGTRCHKHEVIADAVERLTLTDLSQAVMVGDRAHDVVGAARVGLNCVAVSWGYASDGELAAAGAPAVVSTPADLLTWLTRG